MLSVGRQVSKLSGYAPALPTPFRADGEIDSAAFERLCHLQVEAGATALIVGATTGEATTLTPSEHRELVRIAVNAACGQVPVIAGAGSNSTSHAIELSKDAEAAGADAILSVVPYYNKPTQAGLYEHFRSIAGNAGLPIILYDVPSRTACGLADVTVARLAETGHFIGLKDATGDVARVTRLRLLLGSEFRLLSGDDATALGFLAQGGNGCISVTSNVAPGLCRDMYLIYKRGQTALAQRISLPIAELTAGLFREASPAPLKYALSLFALMRSDVRLPLVGLSQEGQAEINSVVRAMCEQHADGMIAKFYPVHRGHGLVAVG